ncbi:unnamed protein product [Caenorhabditis bovis]|uniref:dolichol kinase n=1 Tax=Caenorhabditis bovis TaxID=2654633 RepID=A0A8S1EQ58_9PELO|nr:unnamed protein product [Caenorhabditis bovis]
MSNDEVPDYPPPPVPSSSPPPPEIGGMVPPPIPVPKTERPPNVPDDNLITRRKNITKGIEEIRTKKAEISKALKEVSSKKDEPEGKVMMKQLIDAFDVLSTQETQYLDILKTIVNIHEQATLDVANEYDEKIKIDEQALKNIKSKIDQKKDEANAEPANDEDMDELHQALSELKKVSEAAIAASELNEKLVERLQMQKKKKNAMMELRQKKTKELEEEASRVRKEVMERINKLSAMKKTTVQQERELENLRRQCLHLGLQVGATNDQQIDESAIRAVSDDSQRVPEVAQSHKAKELTEEEKEKRRNEIRENIRKEMEEKERVNAKIREKLAGMAARKKRLQEIREMLERNANEKEAIDALVPPEAREEPVEEAQSIDDIFENARNNLNSITAMRERLEEIQKNGGADLTENDMALLSNLDAQLKQEDAENVEPLEHAIRESFNSVFASRPVPIGVEARLISIESAVLRSNQMLEQLLKQKQEPEQPQQQCEPADRICSLSPVGLREFAARLLRLAEHKESRVGQPADDITAQIRDILNNSQIMIDLYSSLALVAVVATVSIVIPSPLFSRIPIFINFLLISGVSVAVWVYSLLIDRTILGTVEVLVEIVAGTSWRRIYLILFWLFNVAISVLFTAYVTKQGRSSTIHRKFFHLTVSLIYTSGIFVDPQFTWLCGWLWLCIFVLIELLRYFNVPPWGELLNEHLLVFKDAQDSELLLTPIYLLIGIFQPLFISCAFASPLKLQIRLTLFAGVAAVGVGDSFAAIIGSKFGITKWNNSHKSMEGTAAMFISMLFYLLAMNLCVETSSKSLSIIIASLISSLIEAFINNCDNILLPFITYILL